MGKNLCGGKRMLRDINRKESIDAGIAPERILMTGVALPNMAVPSPGGTSVGDLCVAARVGVGRGSTAGFRGSIAGFKPGADLATQAAQ